MRWRCGLLLIFFLSIVSFTQQDAAALLKSGRVDEALVILRARVAANPADAEAWNLTARAWFQAERWDDSIRAAERAVGLKPDSSQYHQWLGRAYGRRAEVTGPVGALMTVRKVKAEFERAVNLSADNLSARADLAEFYTEAPSLMGGDKTKARQLADYVAQRDPAQGHYIRARVAEKQKRADAEAEFKAEIAASHLAEAWTDLASYYRRSGRFEEMQAAVDKAALAAGNSVALFYGARTLFVSDRNFSGAVQMLRSYLAGGELVEDGPAFQAHHLLGLLLEKQGDPQAAAKEFRTALALASQYKPAQDALARVSR